MNVPDWFELVLLFAAAWRVFQLIGHDDILDGPRRRVLRLGKTWKKNARPGTPESEVPDDYRLKWGVFITCPYCAGFWIGLVWWAAWQISEHWTEVVAVPFAISAGVIGLHKILQEEEEK